MSDIEMKIIGFVFLAIGVNLIGYIITFITGFRIGKRKAKSEEHSFGEYPCNDYLNNALRFLLRNGEGDRELAIEEIVYAIRKADGYLCDDVKEKIDTLKEKKETNTTVKPNKIFEEIIVTYPPEDLCPWPEFRGKPYFEIRFLKDGEDCVGYGAYDPKVLSSYLSKHFINSGDGR